MTSIEPLVFTRLVASSTEVAWAIVSDMSAFGDAAPSLSKAEVIDGAGEGMQRRCFDTRGRSWDEVCTLWEEGHRYSMRVRTETYPFALRQMFRRFSGTWEVEPYMSAARVRMRYEVELSLLGRAFSPLICGAFVRQCHTMLDNWQEGIESRFQAEGPSVR